ncbi:hypothetical protein D3C86_1998620 [compost metagenome]
MAAGLEGLDDDLAVAAQAQRNLGSGQIAFRGVEVLVEQLTAFPTTFVALLQQRVFAQGSQGFTADAQFYFGFFLHGWRIQALMTGSV